MSIILGQADAVAFLMSKGYASEFAAETVAVMVWQSNEPRGEFETDVDVAARKEDGELSTDNLIMWAHERAVAAYEREYDC